MHMYSELLNSQQVSAEDIYIAELMVESNVTLDADIILSVLNGITSLTVKDINNVQHQVDITGTETVAECLIVGSDTSCNCSAGYMWSNVVCYSYNCCRETTCTSNVSYVTPLCIKKVPIYVNGLVTLAAGSTWDLTKSNQLVTAFEVLNGFETLNVTARRTDSQGNAVTDFEVGLSVKFETNRLQTIVNPLQTTLMAFIRVDTTGFVYIDSPQTKVCYESSPVLKCTLEEPTDKAGWNMSTTYERFELNNGSVVQLDHACKTTEYQSCVAVTLKKVTGVWEGTYECGFNKGSVRHTAKAYLSVARLPDNILLKINPLTGDCSTKLPSDTMPVVVNAIILKTNNTYTFESTYNGKINPVNPTVSGTNVIYQFSVPLSCEKTEKPQIVMVIFKNDLNQTKNANVTIPVIYDGATFCNEDILSGELWPKTPSQDTAVNNTCEVGRVGYKTRTCGGTSWMPVFTSCVNQELNKISNAAESFLQGFGATEAVALDIFKGLENNTSTGSGSNDNIADLTASINVLDMMAQASKNIALGKTVLPSLVATASNMLNKTWDSVNNSILHNMSANYLKSLEGLIKNIDVNGTNDTYNRPFLDLKYCDGDDCALEVFGVNVNLNKSGGMMKTVGVKNLMNKLNNEQFKNAKVTDVLVSTTLEDSNSSERNVFIKMQFQARAGEDQKPMCVFWDTELKDWSNDGCTVKSEDNSTGAICECTHLTS